MGMNLFRNNQQNNSQNNNQNNSNNQSNEIIVAQKHDLSTRGIDPQVIEMFSEMGENVTIAELNSVIGGFDENSSLIDLLVTMDDDFKNAFDELPDELGNTILDLADEFKLLELRYFTQYLEEVVEAISPNDSLLKVVSDKKIGVYALDYFHGRLAPKWINTLAKYVGINPRKLLCNRNRCCLD